MPKLRLTVSRFTFANELLKKKIEKKINGVCHTSNSDTKLLVITYEGKVQQHICGKTFAEKQYYVIEIK